MFFLLYAMSKENPALHTLLYRVVCVDRDEPTILADVQNVSRKILLVF
jgi:hypothetical protein